MTATTTAVRGRAAALSLYRSLLKAHARHLPAQMRNVGDAYVKSEFRLHKTAKPEQLGHFFFEWEKYLKSIQVAARANESLSSDTITKQDHKFEFGKELPLDLDLSEEQKGQLEKLKSEAQKIRNH